MKVLIMEWKSFGHEDILEAFTELGYEISSIPFDNHKELFHDDLIEASMSNKIQLFQPDFVFSFNYFPIISRVCNTISVPYISWVYDNPQVLMYSVTIVNPCNLVFTFDKAQYLEFHNNRIETVKYLPLAANTQRLSKMKDYISLKNSKWNPKASISFIGSMYTESHQFYNRLNGINDYTRGYLRGLMESQKHVYGYNFIEKALNENSFIVDDMATYLPLSPDPQCVATREFLFAQYVINRQITAEERTTYLTTIGKRYPFDLYTPDEKTVLPGAVNHGKVDYYDMAPYVFKASKINLNFTLRSITSGIPLRCFDILGAGGFLLTNYQADFEDCYVAGEDYVFFEDPNDLLEKIDYYINHENERKEIAHNGFTRTSLNHTYTQRILEMVEYL